MNNNFLSFIGLSSLLLISCSSDMEFEQEKWRKEIDGEYPYRDRMVNDLLEDKKFKGIPYDSLVRLLGQPQQYGRTEKSVVNYLLVEDYGINIDPVYVKLLKVQLSGDSTVESFRVWEWSQ